MNVKIRNSYFIDDVMDVLDRNIDNRLIRTYIGFAIKDELTTLEALLYLDISIKSYELFDDSLKSKYVYIYNDIKSRYALLSLNIDKEF